ncbi:MAG: hypothetical protein ACUVT5_01620 [Candidatus Bathyarchaeales archaeon]
MKRLLEKKGQFSIIAAALVAIVLATALITTYSMIKNNPLQERPQILGSVDEMNLAIDHILEFAVGYYGSILQITGNTTYAQKLATEYLVNGLQNIAYTHPSWNPAFEINHLLISASWFNRTSLSEGAINVTYSLAGLGISGIKYSTSLGLKVTVNPSMTNYVLINVSRDGDKPYPTLSKTNFLFYNYSYAESDWELKVGGAITSIFSTETYSTYEIMIPNGVDPKSYMVLSTDPRGISVVASTFSHYTYSFSWNQSLYSPLTNDVVVVEALQNGSLRWLGQNLQLTTSARPIPPVPIRALRVNQTINGVSREVPFQVEDWGSEYKVPLGIASNASIFGSRNMLVFLWNHQITNVTLWWDGQDTVVQSSYAITNRYFTGDDPANGILTNGKLALIFKRNDTEYLYVDGFNASHTSWATVGASPYLNDNVSNYIYTNTDLNLEGWFSFQNPTYVGITSVRVEFETMCSGNEYFDFQITDGVNTYGYYTIDPDSSYRWKHYDVSSSLNTWEKIVNAKIRVRFRYNSGSSSTVYIRRARIRVTYDTTQWGVKSVLGNSVTTAEFLRINGERSTFGANASYVIHHGIVRDIVQQEAEWSGGIANSPNVYAQIVIMLPANATYYTYALRTIFVSSTQSRTVNELSAIQLHMAYEKSTWGSVWGLTCAENGTSAGYPVVQNVSSTTTQFYNSTSTQTGWAHHWSEFVKNNNGGGVMFTNASNFNLYVFDKIAEAKTGALSVTDTLRANYQYVTIEVNPVKRFSVSFQNPLDTTWFGAVVNFDATDPIYPSNGTTGLWILVEKPPTISVS